MVAAAAVRRNKVVFGFEDDNDDDDDEDWKSVFVFVFVNDDVVVDDVVDDANDKGRALVELPRGAMVGTALRGGGGGCGGGGACRQVSS